MMATILGPDVPMDPSVGSVPPHLLDFHADSSGGILDGSEVHNSQLSPRSDPPPNPPFVFPARASPSSAPSSFSRASGRRPKSLADSLQLTAPPGGMAHRRASLSPPLPDFAFNPGALSPRAEPSPTSRSPLLPDFKFNPGVGMSFPPPLEHPFLSPPQSPHTLQAPPSPRSIPTRPGSHGHKRGGSEFVGGQIRSGDAIVLSTSPTKSESGFASPPMKPTTPRRGHAHRRSAAISSHDLSMIMKPTNPLPRGDSAPSSPVIAERVPDYSLPTTSGPVTETEMLDVSKVEETRPKPAVAGPVEKAEPPARAVNRARVGFSDTLEFIPRPLSLVSSDTSSSMTARPGHSVSGSISSLISLASTISHGGDMPVLSPSPSRNSMDPRPSTAGEVLDRSLSPGCGQGPTRSPQRRNSIALLNTTATNATEGPDSLTPGKAQKRWSFFGLEPFTAALSPTSQPRRLSSSSSDITTKQANSSSSSVARSDDWAFSPTEEQMPTNRLPSRKNSKMKKKRVRSWAGSILTKKPKPRHSKKPSKSRLVVSPSLKEETCNQDGDVKVDAAPESTPKTHTDWESRPDTAEEDPPYPMIDLDAALGPFNTPLPRNPEWEAAQRASGLTKRPLHSAARLGGFGGPGPNAQHRRSESAPEMPPFNRAGLPRYNSNSTMADVFEEDEEDDGKAGGKSQSAGSSTLSAEGSSNNVQSAGIDIRVTPDTASSPSLKAFEYEDDVMSSRALSHKGSGLSASSDEDRQPGMGVTLDHSASSLHDETILEDSPQLIPNGKDSRGSMGGDGWDSATPSPRRILKGKDLTPVDVSPLRLPAASLVPVSPYSVTHSSSFPSPRSPMSYEDGNRISTAPSSVTEDNFLSLLLGEPGPEVRISMDIPSLTSSNSTMTRDSAFVHQLSQAPIRGERPASFSSPFGRRGSLASIGRLISTSHGERSKLSTEVSLESDQQAEKKKQGKVKRLSRLMQFWKAKEGSASN